MRFHLNIKHLRKQLNLSQKKFGDLFGVGGGNISNYETKKSQPTLDGLIDIAKYFEVSLDDLVFKNLSTGGTPKQTTNYQKVEQQGVMNKIEDINQINTTKSVKDIISEKEKEIAYLKKLIAAKDKTIALYERTLK